MTLPIDEIRDEFERRLHASNRLVVTAETGAGKSTRVPVWLAERVRGLILVVEPRRVSCDALADFLSSERGEATGAYFGSRVRFSDRSSERTRVLFCTPGIALRMLTDATVPGAIVVDEFHERSWQMDLVVAAAASVLRLSDVPLILTSATIDAESAAKTLGAYTLHAPGRMFPVDVSYDSSTIEPSADEIGPRAANAITKSLRAHEGDVLVFLPGIKEIRAVESSLGRRDEEVLIVHGSQPPEAMRRVFQRSSRRRIYLSTNVAETSITLPGVRIVIDSGLAKTRLHRAGRAVLATVPISDASMQQRAGRAGRVTAGVCVRLWSERFDPEPYQRPEIERVELDDLLLQAAELGLVGAAFDSATWITPPPSFAVRRALERLRSLCAIDQAGLTERGERLARLPVSAEEATLLVDAPASIDATLCDLVAILQGRGGFLRNLDDLGAGERSAVLEARIELLEGVSDEVTTSLRLLRDGVAGRHHLSRQRLDEARAISRQLRELTGAVGESWKGLDSYILERLPQAGFVRRPRADNAQPRSVPRSVPWANGTVEVQVFPFDPVDPKVEPRKCSASVILETEWLASKTGVRGIGRMVLPSDPQVFAAAGLGEVKVAHVQLDKSSPGQIKISAIREIRLAGVCLASGEVELSGSHLHRAIADLVLENRLFRGSGDALRDALHGWALLAQWQHESVAEHRTSSAQAPTDPATWLTQRIATLGVESAADLALLDAADLLPDLEAETGVPAWIAAPLVKAFPRVWMHQGGEYSCSVRHTSRTVEMEPLDAKARKLKEPSAGALPRFEGFAVVYLQGSRRLKLR
ncbi:MAG: helicase-related protein [Planctomycetota bacterium]